METLGGVTTAENTVGRRNFMLYRFYRPLRCSIALVWLLAFGFLIAGCAGSQESAQKGSTSPVSGSFVGETSDPNTLVAVVADKPGQGEDRREVRAYLCDGKTINEWLKGSVSGDKLDLSSDNGAWLEGELASDTASGTITLADGTSLPFEASPATGIAGLYDMILSSDGRMSGTSEEGDRLEGKLGDRVQDGRYLLSGTITPVDGEAQDFQALATPDVSGEIRGIFLADGRRMGGFAKGKGAGFIGPTVDRNSNSAGAPDRR